MSFRAKPVQGHTGIVRYRSSNISLLKKKKISLLAGLKCSVSPSCSGCCRVVPAPIYTEIFLQVLILATFAHPTCWIEPSFIKFWPLEERKKPQFYVTCLLSASAFPGRGTSSATSHWDPGPRCILCCAWLSAVWVQHWGHQCPSEGKGLVASRVGVPRQGGQRTAVVSREGRVCWDSFLCCSPR